jgi:ubiquinone/menaquinone biosynthesis C-methylase UbiE
MTDTQKVATWYDQNAGQEHDRLSTCRLEFSISWRIITLHLEQLGANKTFKILDLGGGTGRYGESLPVYRQVEIITASQDVTQSLTDGMQR